MNRNDRNYIMFSWLRPLLQVALHLSGACFGQVFTSQVVILL